MATANCKLYIAYWILHIAYFILHIVYCILHISYFVLHIANWILHHIMFVTPFKAFNIWTLTPYPGKSCVSQVSRVFPDALVYPSYCRVSHYCRLVITLANILDGGYWHALCSYNNTGMESKVYRVSHKTVYTLS